MQVKEQDKEYNLIENCAKGNLKHQEILYKKFYGYGMSITLRYTKNREDAIEVLNDSFLKVFKNIKKFDKNKSFKAWFKQITVNTSIDFYRKNIKIPQTYDIEDFELENFDIEEIKTLEVEDILKLLNSLPEHYSIIFNLYEIEGYNHYEIAEKLNISASTSRANLSRAKNKLREIFNKQFNTNYAGAIR